MLLWLQFGGEENFKLEDLLAFQAGLSSFTVGVEEAGVLVEKVTFFLLRR